MIVGYDDDGNMFHSYFDEGEWDILMAAISESDSPANEIVEEVMTQRTSLGKITFGPPSFWS